METILSPKEGNYLFSSESVTEGNPDKICDLISDSILDECLTQDPRSKVAIETITKSNMIVLAGEITTNAKIDYDKIVQDRLQKIGYDEERKGLKFKTCHIIKVITLQSEDIKQALHETKNDEDIGAGDQGLMFGYATNETKELFPFSHSMALKLCSKLTEVRKNGPLKYLWPDGKAQVIVEYKDLNGKQDPQRVAAVIISASHDPDIDYDKIYNDIKTNVIEQVIPTDKMDKDTKIYINGIDKMDKDTQILIYGKEKMIVGGPEDYAGLTGRKIICDTYGGWGAHGGGAFSGKDPSKVDRSGAYAARWIAKSLVKEKLCDRVLVQISYSIGKSEPLSIFVNSYGTSKKYTDEKLVDIVKKNFNLKPGAIINELELRKPIYSKTACGGHFGREDQGFPWENPKKLKL